MGLSAFRIRNGSIMSLLVMGDLLGEFGDEDQSASTDVLGSVDTQNPRSPPPSALDAMLGGSDDDDLFSAPAPEPVVAADQPPSALITWQHQKDEELREKDARDTQAAEARKAEAKESLDKFNKQLAEAQDKRAIHNRELDSQKKADLDADSGNQWEKVVKFVDFNRSDLHERDVSKFKTLLLQLKH
jgi:hypothetical protein